MITEKKEYIQPKLTILGDVEKITLSGVLPNADSPGGNDGTADCPVGSRDPRCLS